MPARKTKAGAQKWVTQRVKKTAGVRPPAATPENTRTWSSAISTMTAPRMMSSDGMRARSSPDEPSVWRMGGTVASSVPGCYLSAAGPVSGI